MHELASGAVVEENITGTRFTSRRSKLSSRLEVKVLATHEQVLGGDTGQVYIGCGFPADPAYVSELARPWQERLASSRQSRCRRAAQRGLCGDPERQQEMAHLRAGDQPSRGRHDAPVRRPQPPGSRQLRSRCRGVAGVERHAAVVLGDEQPRRRRVVLGLAPNAVIRAVAAEGLILTLEPGPGWCCTCCRALPSTDGSA